MSPSPSLPTLSRRTAVHLGSASLALLVTLAASPAQAHTLASQETNKAIIKRLFEAGVTQGDEPFIMSLYAPEYVDRDAWTRHMPGPAGMPLSLSAFRAAFPDVTMTIDPLCAEGDLVAARVTWWDTHPPAGRHVAGRTMHIFRLADGLILEEWSSGWDWLTAAG